MPNKFIPPAENHEFTLDTNASVVPTVIPSNLILEDWLKSNIRQFDVTLNLPPELLQWIGTIASYWAAAEWIQAGTLARILKIGRKKARVMFGDRIGQCIPRIRQSMEMDNIPLPDYITNGNLAGSLTACEKARNLVCHGVWLTDPETGELCVQNPIDEWVDPTNNKIKVSRRKYPEAFYPDTAWFNQRLNDIKSAIRGVQTLDGYLDAWLPPSPRTDD